MQVGAQEHQHLMLASGPAEFLQLAKGIAFDELLPLNVRRHANQALNLNPAYIGPNPTKKAMILVKQSQTKALLWAEETNPFVPRRRIFCYVARWKLVDWSQTRMKELQFIAMSNFKHRNENAKINLRWLKQLQSVDQIYIDRNAVRSVKCLGLSDKAQLPTVKWELNRYNTLVELEIALQRLFALEKETSVVHFQTEGLLRENTILEAELNVVKRRKTQVFDPILAELISISVALNVKIVEETLKERHNESDSKGVAAMRRAILKQRKYSFISIVRAGLRVKIAEQMAIKAALEKGASFSSSRAKQKFISAVKKIRQGIRLGALKESIQDRKHVEQKTLKQIEALKSSKLDLGTALGVNERYARMHPVLEKPLIHKVEIDKLESKSKLPRLNVHFAPRPPKIAKRSSIELIKPSDLPDWCIEHMGTDQPGISTGSLFDLSELEDSLENVAQSQRPSVSKNFDQTLLPMSAFEDLQKHNPDGTRSRRNSVSSRKSSVSPRKSSVFSRKSSFSSQKGNTSNPAAHNTHTKEPDKIELILPEESSDREKQFREAKVPPLPSEPEKDGDGNKGKPKGVGHRMSLTEKAAASSTGKNRQSLSVAATTEQPVSTLRRKSSMRRKDSVAHSAIEEAGITSRLHSTDKAE